MAESSFEDHPLYALALLAISFEMRGDETAQLEEILGDLLQDAEASPEEFADYLMRYRDDLRRNCRTRGYC